MSSRQRRCVQHRRASVLRRPFLGNDNDDDEVDDDDDDDDDDDVFFHAGYYSSRLEYLAKQTLQSRAQSENLVEISAVEL